MKRSRAILLKPPDVERRVKTQRREDVQRFGITPITLRTLDGPMKHGASLLAPKLVTANPLNPL